MAMQPPILQMTGMRKCFNGVEVLHSVDLTVEKGTVVALVGENGAGKSTLMKILMGEYSPDGGSIVLDGQPVVFQSPHQALDHGISMMFQEMSPFPNLTVAQNIFVGREPHHFSIVNTRELRRMARELLDSLKIHLDPDRLVRTLTISEMQLLEIAKAVSHDSKIVIMDEPSSALTDSEVELLFLTIRTLKARGVSILYISHKLDELFVIADKICVLRDGSIISGRPVSEVDRNQMISEMVGRTIDQVYPTVEKEIGEVIYRVKGLERRGVFHDISFELRAGEILGFAGMVGAGRTEIAEVLFGLEKHQKGTISLHGKPIDLRSVKDAVRHHLALIPEDRARCGLNLKGSILSNLAMTVLAQVGFKGFASRKREQKSADEMISKMHIKLQSAEQDVISLSGGNQQKVVVGKWLLTHPDIIFMDEPTRGIDVGAKYEIYQLIQSLAKEGKAVLMISSEMPELLGICDRILVLKEGRNVGELDAKDASQEKIMTMIVNG